ncbi:MAG: hypothetical protein AMXMBFR58_24140 [Phycisphaerae bacterium]|nr:PEP-CTERM sorting domain-containing protein [Phycisphaerales bacterium]
MKKGMIAAVLVAGLAGAANADLLYSNAWDQTGNAYSSQNDTATYGNFATAYAFFTTGGAQWNVTDIHVVGEFFNPPEAAPIAGMTVKIFADAGNAPGALLSSTYVPAGSFIETSLGNVGGFPCFKYDMDVTPTMVTGDAWVSVVPDVAFPPQWGWATGVDANPSHAAWQDFFGTPGRLPASLALDVTGRVVPAPASLALLGIGGLVAGRRRR